MHWWNRDAIALTLCAVLSRAAIVAAAPPVSKSADHRESVFFARSHHVRMRARPDGLAPALPISLLGVAIAVRAEHGDWLDASWGWLRRDEFVAAEEAVDCFSAELARSPSVFAYLGRASALVEKSQFDRARIDVGEALRLCPGCARAYFVLARCAQQQLLAEESFEHLNRAVRFDSGDPVALAFRGKRCLSRNAFDRAAADCKAADALLPGFAPMHRDFGDAWLRKDQYDKAVFEYDRAAQLDRGDARAYAGRGWARACQRQFKGAIADLDKAIRLDPKLPMLFITRGEIRVRQGDFPAAILDFDEAIRLDPKSASAYLYRGTAKGRHGQYDGALADLRRAVKLLPDIPTAHVALAAALNSKGWSYNASVEATKALRLDPNSTEALFQRAYAFCRCSPKQAVEDFSSLLRGEPTSAAALAGRAVAYNALGDWERAIEDSNAALRQQSRDPRSLEALGQRAYARMRRGEYQLANDDWTAFVKFNPARAEIWEYRGICQHHLGNLQAAVADYQESLRLVPKQSLVSSELRLAERQLHPTESGNLIMALFRKTESDPPAFRR